MNVTNRLKIQQKEIFMEEYLSILRSAQLFSGVTEAELLSMLTCLDAKTESYPREVSCFEPETGQSLSDLFYPERY